MSNSTAFVAKYVNDGATYAGATLVKGALDADKEWIAIDSTGGPNDGNIYLAFDASLNVTAPFATLFTRSTDGGKTFSKPFYAPADQTGTLPGVTVDPAGNVYVSSLAVDPVTFIPLNYTQVTKITNGGTTIAQSVRAVDPASWVSGLNGASFRAFTIPQIASDSHGVYLVFDDMRLGRANVYLTRSTDGGSTWTAPLKINDVTAGQNFFPTIAASSGIINVAWYQGLNNTLPPPPMTLAGLRVLYSQSLDAGMSFSPSTVVSGFSNPETVKRTDGPGPNMVFIGDYIGIAATSTAIHPIWTDNTNACDTTDPVYGCVDQDVYTATITVTPPQPVHDVGIYGLATNRNFAYNSVPSNPVRVNVTAVNLGSTVETFNVTTKANSTIIGIQKITLAAGNSTLLSFPWHPELLAKGNYTITALASTVPGETNTANNAATYNAPFANRLKGDVNNDCLVDIVDLSSVGASFGRMLGQVGYNLYANINNDGVINIVDLVIVASVFGTHC